MTDEINGKLEFPTNNVKIYLGIMIVKGWAFSKKSDNLSIEIFIDGNLVDKGRWGLPRYDIFKIYNSEESYESGFIARVSVQEYGDGLHVVKVLAKSSSSEKLLGKIDIKIGEKEIGDKAIPSESVPVGCPGQFKEFGQRYFQYFVELGNLKPNHRVLEIGCGMGRTAMPLTKFLKNGGEYFGIDLIPEAIQFCKDNITSRYPNFHFSIVEAYNKMYNPEASKKASEYKFPFENECFDFIFLASVFTHMVLEDVENYVSEIARVLKTGQRCFSTFFLINRRNSPANISDFHRNDFEHKFEGTLGEQGNL